MSDKGAVTFRLGNNPLASGTYNVGVVSEPSGAAFLAARPGRALWLAFRKFLYVWGVIRDTWNVPRPAGLWLYRATRGFIPLEASLPLARGGWLGLAGLVAVGFLARARTLTQWWLLPAIVAAVCAAHVVTLSSHRFAIPVLPVVFVLAAGPTRCVGGVGDSMVVQGAVGHGARSDGLRHVCRLDDLGAEMCREDIPVGMLTERDFAAVWVPCPLRRDGPTTLIVQALGKADLSILDVAFVRRPGATDSRR